MRKSGRHLPASVFASLSGMAMGYNMAVIASAMLFFRVEFSLTQMQLGVVVGAFLAGLGTGSSLGGGLADRLGRNRVLMISSGVGGLLVLSCACAPSAATLALFRFLAGVLFGTSSTVAPVYIAEVVPQERRGGLVSLYQLNFALGIVLAYAVGTGLAGSGNWRAMVAAGVVISAIQFCGLMTVPPSPRWLLSKNRVSEARHAMALLYGPGRYEAPFASLQSHFRTVQLSCGGWRQLLRPDVRLALLVGLVFALAQQFTGVGAVLSYAPVVFERAGFRNPAVSIALGLAVSGINVLGTVITIYTIDRWGRRPLLLWGLGGIVVTMSLMGWNSALSETHPASAWLLVVSTLAYRLFYALSLGPIFAVLVAEIFPDSVRGRAVSLTVTVMWAGSLSVGMLFPWVSHRLGINTVFQSFACFGIVSWWFFWRYLPETRGLAMEAVSQKMGERAWGRE